MARLFEQISNEHQDFIKKQHMFFVGTAATSGNVNVSPKGMDSLRVINENKVIWLNLTGSGNETAIHIQNVNRMTIMFCSFEKRPMILRLYGKAIAHHRGTPFYVEHIDQFQKNDGARQIFEMKIELVQTSCGYAVPFMDFIEERDTLNLSLKKKEEAGIEDYWKETNGKSIDGFESDVFK